MICFKCNRDLPGTMFKSQSRHGAAPRTSIPRQCLDCTREWHRLWAERRRRAIGMRTMAERHPEEVKKANREKKRVKNIARIREWSERNRERTLDVRRAGWERFNARYPDRALAALAKGRVNRRVGMKNRTPSWGQEGIGDVYLEAEYFQMEVDHIIPLQARKASGLHVWDNLQLLPRSVNRAKRNSFDPLTFQN